MKVGLYAVLDTASAVYDGPVPAHTDEVAMRNFANMAANKEAPIGKNPEYYSLWRVGTWDDSVGGGKLDNKYVLCNAIDILNIDKTEN